MVGNDIVDLSLADKVSWNRPRFLDKVCTSSEQLLLADAEDPATFFWVLWSMKESAYKLHFRKYLTRALNPIRFACYFEGSSVGRVEVANEIYQTHSIVNQDFIHTIASDAKTEVRSKEVSVDDWKEVRTETIQSLIQSFSSLFDLNPKKVNFKKDIHGIPYLTEELNGIFNACSISHHGKYGAHALAI